MSAGSDNLVQQDDPQYIQDDADGLPSYDNLAAKNGPNSRQGWVEKRAAERYLDEPPEARAIRSAGGWGESSALNDSTESPAESPHESVFQARTQTDLSLPPAYVGNNTENPSSPISLGQRLAPSHIDLYTFGSRFLPHSTNPIYALLPFMNDQYLLLGSQDGLSMLEMFPTEAVNGLHFTKGPSEACRRSIWTGEGVYQLSVLENLGMSGNVPQGVILALVGADPSETNGDKDKAPMRSIRMYNMSSLASLVNWRVSQHGKPVDLKLSPLTPQQTPIKKHRHNGSITKGLKALVIESAHNTESEPRTSYHRLTPTNSPVRDDHARRSKRSDTVTSTDSSWDIVEDLPLRWATDYIPLALSSARSANASVNFFELWRDDTNRESGKAMLAVATKSCVLLYETLRGERAFKFVKEFYTPLPSRSISFIYQTPPDSARSRRISTPSSLDYGRKLCLFVTFDKKATIIRLADSAVLEVDLYDDQVYREPGFAGLPKELKGHWLPLSVVALPMPQVSLAPTLLPDVKTVYLLSRGKFTHIVPSPLSTPVSSTRPYAVLAWQSCPSRVVSRVCKLPTSEPFLQVVAFGEEGVEVQELSVSTLFKGKGRAEQVIRAYADVGADAGFLCGGGHWDLHTSNDGSSMLSTTDATTPLTETSQTGFYAWSRKGLEDWRVFWLGGGTTVNSRQYS
ncbi:hypothetical protein SISNIDRAFT_481679 [Sistotremastrum niveocremeum HHB9708]|uniref:Uncharacterized protein n=2 Tax=Sistotremastraceae TaxID=3402574 RepID=A0A164ZJQ3_9AGAM|nr:hypothetical protein SISNIDRAFT_481679 [Sistotremastrum niveocremeum HHB9708]KZT42913.1 hypothetical protein SISSUDRAFT_1058058 [Sistotremastrum suecicum HHB10207 ss-3]